MTKSTHKHAHAPAGPSVNDGMTMSADARARMRRREKDVYNYYDDAGPGKGHCTWGVGILAHKNPCTKEELAKPVSAAAVEAEFSRRVAGAEADVVRHVRNQKLPQDQFDAPVRLTFNAGVGGAGHTLAMIDRGDLAGATSNIKTLTSTHVNGKKVKGAEMSSLRLSERFATLILAVLAVPALASSTANDDIAGTWKLTKVLDYAEVTAMDDDQAEKLVGKTLEVRKGALPSPASPVRTPALSNTA